jgi:hypothetical protein
VASEGESHRKAPENTDVPLSGDKNICLATGYLENVRSLHLIIAQKQEK